MKVQTERETVLMPSPDTAKVVQRLKLGKEAQVVFVVQPDVVYTVFQHSDALNPHTKGKAGIDIRIITDLGEHCRINQTRPKYFKPACLLAYPTALASADDAGNIHFGAGFGEGKKTGAEPEGQVAAEHALAEAGEHTF